MKDDGPSLKEQLAEIERPVMTTATSHLTNEQRIAEYRCKKCQRSPTETAFDIRLIEGVERPRHLCRQCEWEIRSRQGAEQALARTDERVRGEIVQFVRAASRRTTSTPAIRDLVETFSTKVGGVNSLAEKMVDHFNDVTSEANIGSTKAMKAFEFVLRLMKAGVEEERVELEVSALTDDQLQAAADRFLQRKIIDKMPELEGSFEVEYDDAGDYEEETEAK